MAPLTWRFSLLLKHREKQRKTPERVEKMKFYRFVEWLQDIYGILEKGDKVCIYGQIDKNGKITVYELEKYKTRK